MPKWNYFVYTVLVWHLAAFFFFLLCFSFSAEALSLTMLTVENGILRILLKHQNPMQAPADKGFLYLSFFFFFFFNKWGSRCLFFGLLLFSFRRLKQGLVAGVLSSVIHDRQKVKAPKCPSADGWVDIQWYVHTTRRALFGHEKA